MSGRGKVTATSRPPAGRARASSSAPCASAIARTIASPRPYRRLAASLLASSAGTAATAAPISLRRDDRTGVAHQEPSSARRATVATSTRPPVLVPHRVVDEVGHQALGQPRVTREAGRGSDGRPGPSLVAAAGSSAAAQGTGRPARPFDALFAAGQRQQRVDETLLAAPSASTSWQPPPVFRAGAQGRRARPAARPAPRRAASAVRARRWRRSGAATRTRPRGVRTDAFR